MRSSSKWQESEGDRMALTVTRVMTTAIKDAFVTINKVDFDSSYPTNGETLTSADLGFSDVANNLTVLCFPKAGYVAEYDGANAKIKVYWGDNNNASDGPLVEVANTTDISAITDMYVLAVGKELA